MGEVREGRNTSIHRVFTYPHREHGPQRICQKQPLPCTTKCSGRSIAVIPLLLRPRASVLLPTAYLAMALQVARHFWQASAHFLQQGISPHFRHSAAQFSHAFAHSSHIAPDSGASYSIKATHARHVSKQVRQCFSQLGQSQLTRHSRQARRHSLQAWMQFSLSTGSSFVSAATAD